MIYAILIAAILIASMLYEISAAIRYLARTLRENNFDGPGEPVEVHTRLSLADEEKEAVRETVRQIKSSGGGWRAR